MKKILKLFMFSFFTFIIILVSSCSKNENKSTNFDNDYISNSYYDDNCVSNPYVDWFGTRIKTKKEPSETQEIEVSYGGFYQNLDLVYDNNYSSPNQELKFELYRCIVARKTITKYKHITYELPEKMIYTFNDTLSHFFNDFKMSNQEPVIDVITKDELKFDDIDIETNSEKYIYYYYKLTPINEENILLFDYGITPNSIEVYSPIYSSQSGTTEYKTVHNEEIYYDIVDGKINFLTKYSLPI